MKFSEILDLDDVLQIKDLSYEKWKMKVLSQVDDALVTACLLFIEQMRSNVELSKEEKNHVKFAIQSFTEVIIINRLKFKNFFYDFFFNFFELCALCISILQALTNRLHQTVFRNSTGNTLFRAYFDFGPYIVSLGRKLARKLARVPVRISSNDLAQSIREGLENATPLGA